MRVRSRSGARLCLLVVTLFGSWAPWPARAQLEGDTGDAERIASAQRLALLAVQQGLTALSPPTAQSVNYVYDPVQEIFRRNEKLGPVSFLTAETVGRNVSVLRFSAAAFSLDDSVGVFSRFDSLDADGNVVDSGEGVESIGIDAAIYIFSLGFSYGLTDRLDVGISLPIVIADVQGFAPDPDLGARFVFTDEQGFEDDSAIGLGGVALGAKAALLDTEWLAAALSFEVVLPSPNEDHYAGPESFAFFPQAAVTVPLASWLSVGGSAGYNHQLDDEELRRIAWKAGAWASLAGATFDAGVSGAEFDEDITFLPDREFFGVEEPLADGTVLVERNSLEDATVDNSYVAVVSGIKWPVSRSVSLTAGVTIPVIGDGINPRVIGSLGLEYQGGVAATD